MGGIFSAGRRRYYLCSLLKTKWGGGGEGEAKEKIKGDSLGFYTGDKVLKNMRS